jgi:hypothetical protein
VILESLFSSQVLGFLCQSDDALVTKFNGTQGRTGKPLWVQMAPVLATFSIGSGRRR